MLRLRLFHNNFIRLISLSWSSAIIACLVLLHSGDAFADDDKTPKTYADFAALKNESFSVYGGKGLRKVIFLKLIEVSQAREQNKTVEFSLRFQGPADYPLDKNVYTFEHAKTGAFPLFLEPAGADVNGRYYQALFNLLK